jgi:hypothetical protein
LLKRNEDDTRGCEEANKEHQRCAIVISIQRAPIEEAGRLFFAEDGQRLLEDATEHRALFAELRMMRRLQEQKREGGDYRAGTSSTPKGVV